MTPAGKQKNFYKDSYQAEIDHFHPVRAQAAHADRVGQGRRPRSCASSMPCTSPRCPGEKSSWPSNSALQCSGPNSVTIYDQRDRHPGRQYCARSVVYRGDSFSASYRFVPRRADRRERRNLDALRNFQTHEFARLMQFVMSRDMPTTRAELNALPVDEQVMFVEFAQQMESLGILVAEDYLSLDLVDKTLGSFVSTSWQKYQAMVMNIREKSRSRSCRNTFNGSRNASRNDCRRHRADVL